MFGDERAPGKQQRGIEFSNASGQTVPSFGVLQITGSSVVGVGREILTATRPDGTAGAVYAVNGSVPVTAGQKGRCTLDFPTKAAYDTGDGTPAIGQFWGPKSGQFTLAQGRPYFLISGTPASGRVFVERHSCAWMIRGTLVGAMTSGDATWTIDNISVVSGGDPRATVGSSSEAKTVYNLHEWDGDDDAIAVAVWNDTESRWELIQVTCPA